MAKYPRTVGLYDVFLAQCNTLVLIIALGISFANELSVCR